MSDEAKRLAEALTMQARGHGAETTVIAVHRGGEWYVCFSGGSLAATGLAHQAVAVMQRVCDGAIVRGDGSGGGGAGGAGGASAGAATDEPTTPTPRCKQCGRAYSLKEWRALAIVSVGESGTTEQGRERAIAVVETRLCQCNAPITLTIPIAHAGGAT